MEKPNAFLMMHDGLDTGCCGNMRLARPGAADQADVVGVVKEIAAMELFNERLIDLAAGEVDAVQFAVGRREGRAVVGCYAVDRTSRTARFRLQKLRQGGNVERRRSLFGQFADGPPVHFQLIITAIGAHMKSFCRPKRTFALTGNGWRQIVGRYSKSPAS